MDKLMRKLKRKFQAIKAEILYEESAGIVDAFPEKKRKIQTSEYCFLDKNNDSTKQRRNMSQGNCSNMYNEGSVRDKCRDDKQRTNIKNLFDQKVTSFGINGDAGMNAATSTTSTVNNSWLSSCEESNKLDSSIEANKLNKTPTEQKRLTKRVQRLLSAKVHKKNKNQKIFLEKNGVLKNTVTNGSTSSCEECDSGISDMGENCLSENSRRWNCSTSTVADISNKTDFNEQEELYVKVTRRIVALDCEFVGVAPKNTNGLGRCSIVDYYGNILCDMYVRPDQPIIDYRTPWSGIRKRDLVKAVPFENAYNHITAILKDKIIIGHSVHNDFKALHYHHPSKEVRDTSTYHPLRQMACFDTRTPVSLKRLSQVLLGKRIQRGEHCSVEDARATMELYKLVANRWEKELRDKELAKKYGTLISRKLKHKQSPKSLKTKTKANPSNYSYRSYLDDEYWPTSLYTVF